MLRHIGLAAVVVALIACTADLVHARGGARSGRSSYGYGFGNSLFVPGTYYPSGGTNASSSTGTGRSHRHKNSNTASNNEIIAPSGGTTSTAKTATLTAGGTSSTSTQPTTTAPTNASGTTSQSKWQAKQAAATTSPLTVSPSLGIPLNTLNPNATTQNSYWAMLSNAKQLIKAGLYGPATNYLQRIISGAPGTKVALEAQRLLASLPTI
jgi:hypothetical protein